MSEPDSRSPIPLFTPEIRGREWEYVRDCLDTAWVSSVGAYVNRFEELVAEAVGARYAVATSCGTAALHMALTLAGVQPNDEVLVSTLTFIASANAVRYCGAWPVFVDAEPDHWQMDVALVERFLAENCQQRDGVLWNRASGRRVSAIVPVHVLGHPVDLDPILALAERYNLPVVEDAAEALGVRYKDRPVGARGCVGCVSFNGNKLITAGGGGMVVTNSESLARRARHLTTQAKSDPIEYIHDEIGYNYRLTNLQAAMGCAQMECLAEFIELKQRTANRYRSALRGVAGIEFFSAAPYASCTYWMNTVQVDRDAFGLDARRLLHALQSRGIQTRPLWQPMHFSPAHRGSQAILSGVSDRLWDECLSLPSSVGLSAEDVAFVCQAIREIGQQATGGRSAA
jgi:perosamine synthetase